MISRPVLLASITLFLFATISLAQIPETVQQQSSPAEAFLQPTVDLNAEESGERLIHHPGWYAAGGVLVAPPILFVSSHDSGTVVLAPLPSPWATIGFRRDNDVAWQTSFLLVPLYDANGSIFGRPYGISTVGLDVDRISTDHSPWPAIDLRWQIGLRIVGIGIDGIPLPFGIGPHIGFRLEWPLSPSLFVDAWSDVGVLPSLLNGIPLVDLRGELGLTWRPLRLPGLSLSLAAFDEAAGFGIDGLMTPGIKARIGWNY